MPLLRPRVERTDKPASDRIPISNPTNEPLLTAVVKWIPIETLTVYKTVDGLIQQDAVNFRIGFAIFVLVITPLWIAFATNPPDKKVAWRQVTLAPIAFLCWAAAMQTNLIQSHFHDWQAWMGSMVLGAGTLALPVIEGILKAPGVPQSQ